MSLHHMRYGTTGTTPQMADVMRMGRNLPVKKAREHSKFDSCHVHGNNSTWSVETLSTRRLIVDAGAP